MTVETCPACESAELEPFFSLHSVPVYCNVLWPTRDEAREAARGRIELGFCGGCGLIYNRAFDPDLLSYTPEYENSLHFSPRFREYAAELAERLIARCDLVDKDIVEIGCGKGEFLAELCRGGRNRGLGFDATYAGAVDEHAETVRIVRDSYSEKYGNEPADLICCRHVLEHLARPLPFLVSVRRAAQAAGAPLVYFEVPDGLWTLRDLGIWDIIYEHCSYFTRPALLALFERAGLRPLECYESFGGQFLSLEAVVGSAEPADRAAEVEGIVPLVRDFAAHYDQKAAHWSARVDALVASGRRVAVWGAGSKGVTFLNAVPGGGRIDPVVDINPRKHGRFVPGTGHEVRPAESLRDAGCDTVLVMNPLYRDEIRADLDALGVTAEIETV